MPVLSTILSTGEACCPLGSRSVATPHFVLKMPAGAQKRAKQPAWVKKLRSDIKADNGNGFLVKLPYQIEDGDYEF